MILFFRILIFVAGILCLPTLSQPRPAPDSSMLRAARKVLTSLTQQHRAAKTFALKFESQSSGSDGLMLPVMKGSLLTADSGRFRLESAAAGVVCDGVTLWQYFPGTKQVLVKNASDAGETGGILLRFLEARAVRAERVRGLLRVVLDPSSVGQTLDSLILTIDPDKSLIRSVETQDPMGNRVAYTVKSLRYGVAVRSNDFVFHAPKGVETVDMR